MALPENLQINGKDYAVSSLSDAARVQIVNIQAVDAEIARLQVQMGIAQTARNAYAGALSAALPAADEAAATATPADATAA